MIDQQEWTSRCEGVAAALSGLSTIDATMVLITVLVTLVQTAPPVLQHSLSMKIAEMMLEPPEQRNVQ